MLWKALKTIQSKPFNSQTRKLRAEEGEGLPEVPQSMKEIFETMIGGWKGKDKRIVRPVLQDSTTVGHGPRTRAGVFKPGSPPSALASPSVKQNS